MVPRSNILKDKESLFDELNFFRTNTKNSWASLKSELIRISQAHEIKIGVTGEDSDLAEFLSSKIDPQYLRNLFVGRSGKVNFSIELIEAIRYGLQLLDADYESRRRTRKRNKSNLNFTLFFDLLKEILPTIGINTIEDFEDKLVRRTGVHKEDLKNFLFANPTVLFSLFKDEYHKLNDNNSQEFIVSRRYYYNSHTNDVDELDEQKFSNYEGVYLGHALSILPDSLLLLCDIGRFLRISKVTYNNVTEWINKSSIYLTSPEWSVFNHSAIQVVEDKEERLNRLAACFEFRKSLYGIVGINIDVLAPQKIEAKYTKYSGQPNYLKRQAEDYYKYSNSLLVFNKNNQTQLKNFLYKYLNSDNKELIVKNLPRELDILKLSIVDDEKNMFIIQTILDHFRSISEDTFYYVLLQRYSQHEFNKHLKVAVESEKTFDQAFSRLDFIENVKNFSCSAYYHKHYYFSTDSNNSPLNIIPYTMPSGRLWKRINNPDDNLPDAINEYRSQVIELWDFQSEVGQGKVKSILHKIPFHELARQISDLFCFCTYAFEEDFWAGTIDEFGNETVGLDSILVQLDPELMDSWSIYRTEPNALSNFKDSFLSIWSEGETIPYYFYPFIHDLSLKNHPNREEIEKEFREKYSKVILFVLERLFEKLKFEPW